MRQLYQVETHARELCSEDRRDLRQLHAVPTLDGFAFWLQEEAPKVGPPAADHLPVARLPQPPSHPPPSRLRRSISATLRWMKTIPQRALRNESGMILRQAEAGERFVITVHGRPVAVLGPYERRQWVPSAAVREMLATPTDPTLLDDLRRLEPEALVDPWER